MHVTLCRVPSPCWPSFDAPCSNCWVGKGGSLGVQGVGQGQARNSPKVGSYRAQKPTFDLFHFVLKCHRAPPLGWTGAVGERVVIGRVVFEQHHIRPCNQGQSVHI